jgi:hypothetical protein
MNRDKNMERLFKGAKDKVITEWGRAAYEKLGSRIQSALLAEAILILINQQDELTSAEISKRIAIEGWLWVIEETNR